MAFLSGYNYRKSVTLSRASGAVTNYQMKLLLGESSGATGEDVDVGGLCKTDFSDIRFTKSDGTTLLDYWIESVSGTTPNQLATIWIEFDSIGTSATTFYMYYGNSSATAVSDGVATFPLFDDFNAGSLDGAKWTSAGSPTLSGGVVTVPAGHSNNIASISTFGQNYAYRSRAKAAKFATTGINPMFGFRINSGSGAVMTFYDFPNNGHFQMLTQNDAGNNIGTNITAPSDNNFHIFSIKRNGSTSTILEIDDNGSPVTCTTNIPSVSCSAIVRTEGNSPEALYADWVLVRQFLGTEPAFGSWGPQEVMSLSNASFLLLMV